MVQVLHQDWSVCDVAKKVETHMPCTQRRGGNGSSRQDGGEKGREGVRGGLVANEGHFSSGFYG